MAGCTSEASESQNKRGCYQLAVVALGQHLGDLDGHGAIMEVMHGGGRIPLSVVRLCGMVVTSRKALDMYGSPHLTISYLLRGEERNLEDKFQGWIDDIGG